MAKVGTIIGGQYEILKQIGHGGMSTVYLGMGKRLGKNWAIKEAKKGDSNSNAARFFEATPIEEANFLKDLHHKNIVSVTDIIEQDGYTYIVEEYLPGQDLEDKMKAGPSPVKDVVHWGEQVCDALDYLHSRNIIYRDMKPANLRLDADGDRVILMDFGIAKRYNPQNPADKYKVGTKGYAPQEQFQGMTDQRSDIYSLGITLKALLLGISPYEPAFNDPRSVARIQGENGDGLLRVLNKATNPDPAKRYQTAAAFGKAIKNYEQISTRYKAKLKKQRNTFFGFVIATAVALVAALVFTGVFIASKSTPIRELAEAQDFDTVLKNACFDEAAGIPFGSQTAKDAAANIVDIFVNNKGENINDFQKSLSLYAKWAELSENDERLIKVIYTEAKDENGETREKDINNALFIYFCKKVRTAEKESVPTTVKDGIINTNKYLNKDVEDIQSFFQKSAAAYEIIDEKGISKVNDSQKFKELTEYQAYLTALPQSKLFHQYEEYGLDMVINQLKDQTSGKLAEMELNQQ